MKKIFVILVCAVSFAAFAEAPAVAEKPAAKEGYLLYQLGKGDHPAKVLREMGFEKQLWGKNGLVGKTMAANEGISKDPNHIPPGTWIYLPIKTVPNKDYEVADGEVHKKSGGGAAVIAPVATPEPTPTPTATPEPTASPTPTPAPEASPEPTPTPVAAATPAATPEPTPAPQPAPVVKSDSYYSDHPFTLSALGGYSSDLFQFGQAGSPNPTGINYGARLEYGLKGDAWGLLINATYRQAQLTDSGLYQDFITMGIFEYGLGVAWKHLSLRFGGTTNNVTDANAVANFTFTDTGYWASLAYTFHILDHFSVSLETHYSTVKYGAGANTSLTQDTYSNQAEQLLFLDYHFGL